MTGSRHAILNLFWTGQAGFLTLSWVTLMMICRRHRAVRDIFAETIVRLWGGELRSMLVTLPLVALPTDYTHLALWGNVKEPAFTRRDTPDPIMTCTASTCYYLSGCIAQKSVRSQSSAVQRISKAVKSNIFSLGGPASSASSVFRCMVVPVRSAMNAWSCAALQIRYFVANKWCRVQIVPMSYSLLASCLDTADTRSRFPCLCFVPRCVYENSRTWFGRPA